jgi:hypothetical protein
MVRLDRRAAPVGQANKKGMAFCNDGELVMFARLGFRM